MKLTNAQINPFLQKPDPSVRVILLYGPDAGLVHERAEALAKKVVPDLNDPFRVAVLHPTALTEDPARLPDEMAAQALGGGRRLLRIHQAVESLAAHLQALLKDAPSSDTVLVIEAGDLEKRSKLRGLCEDSNQAVAIPCYIESGSALEKTVSDLLRAEKINASRDVISYLCTALPPDRLALKSEIEKLVLFLGQEKDLTVENARAVIEDAGTAELDDLVYAVAGGDAAKAVKLYDRLLAEHTPTVTILRAMQRHFMRLEWARYYIESGLAPAEAIKKLTPPVFWKYEEPMIRQLKRWPMAKIDRALHALVETEIAIKKSGANDTVLSAQTLLAMAAA